MTHHVPSYLRLHVEDLPSAIARDDTDSPIERLCRVLSLLSDWQIQRGPGVPGDAIWSRGIGTVPDRRDYLYVAGRKSDISSPRMNRQSICQLAGAVADVAEELATCQQWWKQRCGQPLASEPVASDLDFAPGPLERDLPAILQSAAEVASARSVALYVLDDATEYLLLRGIHSDSAPVDLLDKRPLRGANADLEALAGHAVVMKNSDDGRRWQAPMQAPSAVCVPVSSTTTLLGTLWCFADESQDYSDMTVNMLEIIAGRIAAELECEAALRQRYAESSIVLAGQPMACAGHRSSDVPIDTFANEQWQATSRQQAGQYACCVASQSGDSLVLMGIDPETAGLTGAGLAARAMRRLRDDTDAAPLPQFWREAHHDLLQRSTGDALLAAVQVQLDMASGLAELFAAGHTELFAIRPHAWEALGQPCPPLGDAAVDSAGIVCSTRLGSQDWLLVLCSARLRSIRMHNTPLVDGKHLAEVLLRHNHLSVEAAADALWRILDAQNTVWHHPPLLMLVRNLTSPSP